MNPDPRPVSDALGDSPADGRANDVIVVDVRDPADPPPRPPGDFETMPGAAAASVNIALLDDNDRRAAENRARFRRLGVTALNFVSAPGAGKTTLLARTLAALAREVPCGVLVGDLETDNDARRLRHPGVPVVQITTGSACHLDAAIVARGFGAIDRTGLRLLFVENVGNLVCPAAFDLGETVRVTLFSCTEGEDKPLKYPPIFKSAHVVLLTKIDLAEAAGFDRGAALENIRRIAPQACVFEISSRSGAGFTAWLDFLRSLV